MIQGELLEILDVLPLPFGLRTNDFTLHLSTQCSGYVEFNIYRAVVVHCLYAFSAVCVGIYILFDKQFYNILLVLLPPYS